MLKSLVFGTTEGGGPIMEAINRAMEYLTTGKAAARMPLDLDIHRSANLLVKQRGKNAPIHAAIRADAMLDINDLDGYAVWKRILRAVEELQRTKPKLDEAVH